jgi:hypothetical protein
MKTYPMPVESFVRQWQILGCKRRGIVPIIPESDSSWWAGINDGTRPPPIKLGKNTTVWRVQDIRQYIADGKWRAPEVA